VSVSGIRGMRGTLGIRRDRAGHRMTRHRRAARKDGSGSGNGIMEMKTETLGAVTGIPSVFAFVRRGLRPAAGKQT